MSRKQAMKGDAASDPEAGESTTRAIGDDESDTTLPSIDAEHPVVFTAERQAAGQTRSTKASKDSEQSYLLKLNYMKQTLSLVEADVSFVGHFLGVTKNGSADEFNEKLKDADKIVSIEKSIELGIIVANLGSLDLIPIPKSIRDKSLPADKRIAAEYVLLGGFGEPGRMSHEDIRFVFTNVVFAMRSLGRKSLSSFLVGTRRKILNASQSLRSMLEGIKMGMEMFHVHELTLNVSFVNDSDRRSIEKTISDFRERINDGMEETSGFVIESSEIVVKESGLRPVSDDPENEDKFRTARITVMQGDGSPTSKQPSTSSRCELRYSALTEKSTIPLRSNQIQKYFAAGIPNRLLSIRRFEEIKEYGYLMMRTFVPDDFQTLIEDSDQVTLILDAETAQIPWEMAAFRMRSDTRFYGTQFEISRQFRSMLAEANGHVPELNDRLNVLIIADPASDDPLPGAADEGIAVTKALLNAQKAHKDKVKINIKLRIGHEKRDKGSLEEIVNLFRSGFENDVMIGFDDPNCVVDVQRCDPIEILKLLLIEDFDIVHYAGHGLFNPESGRMGWLLDTDCILSASEIFRVRTVPRLVFANACHSGKLAGSRKLHEGGTTESTMRQQVSMAEAFFARGIQNYVGTGWPVHDELALIFATTFYQGLLGISTAGKPLTKPGTIGAAMKAARRAISIDNNEIRKSVYVGDNNEYNTWGAYQHYGLPNSPVIDISGR